MGEKFSIEDLTEFSTKVEHLLYLKRQDFGSIEHRKELAEYFSLDQQEVLDLPKREFKTLIIGMIKGKQFGQYITTETIKSQYFCVDIDIWNHRKTDFERTLKEVVDELAKENAHDDEKD